MTPQNPKPPTTYLAVIWDTFPHPPERAPLKEFPTLDEAIRFCRANHRVLRAQRENSQPFSVPEGTYVGLMTEFVVESSEPDAPLQYNSEKDPEAQRYPDRDDFELLRRHDHPEYQLSEVEAWLFAKKSKPKSTEPVLSPRFADALARAHDWHKTQFRKRTTIPYISHPLAVASLVMEAGGTEDQAIAALLHDVIEDCDVTKAELERLFGQDVARMVEDCTTPKGIRDYQEKKRAYLDKLRTARNDTLLVALADKLHNSRCIANDIENEGDKVWYRFNADPSLIVWYYRQVHAVLESRLGDENPAITLMLKKSRANTVYFGKLFWKE